MNLRYPIGKFETPQNITKKQILNWIKDIQQLPAQLKQITKDLNAAQLDTVYRSDGWTVRQVVHHVADSHANAYIRFKLAMTEEQPTIRPYLEAKWAELADGKTADIQISLALLTALHKRWVILLKSLSIEDWERTYIHPEHGKVFQLSVALAMYSWHSRHHLAHITALRKRNNW